MWKETEQGNIIFSCTEPLDREYVSFSTDAGGTDNSVRVTHVGDHTLITEKGVVLIEGEDLPARRHCQLQVGSVAPAGHRLRAAGHDQGPPRLDLAVAG